MSQGHDLSDQDIIAACLSGNAPAYAVLVERHQQMVFNVLYRFLGNREASQDISQEAFITAHQKLHLFDGRSKFSTWLCQIALNKARDLLRGQGVECLCDDLEDHRDGLSAPEGDSPHRRAEMAWAQVPHGSPPKREETTGGRVARRCHRASYVASSRLALRKNSSVSFCSPISDSRH